MPLGISQKKTKKFQFCLSSYWEAWEETWCRPSTAGTECRRSYKEGEDSKGRGEREQTGKPLAFPVYFSGGFLNWKHIFFELKSCFFSLKKKKHIIQLIPSNNPKHI